jgi:magnesium-transporting ATPase (P-type)
MITTVTLGRGAVRMARHKVIVKHLAAIQNFGSMDVLCSDKTGTLTSGDTALDQHLDPFGKAAERVFLLAYLNSFYETGVENSVNAAPRKASANPLDVAILRHDHPDVKPYRKLDEIPFDFERRRQSVVIETSGERLMITKGAPESVIAARSKYEIEGNRKPLTAEDHERCEATYKSLSEQGYRVLAVASRALPQQDSYRAADERELVLAGFVTFSDPPLEDAPALLKALKRDGQRTGHAARLLEGRVRRRPAGAWRGTRPHQRLCSRSGCRADNGFRARLTRAKESNHHRIEESRPRCDNVDRSFIRKPRRWDIGIIRKFMLYIGPISSVYDFLTFYIRRMRVPLSRGVLAGRHRDRRPRLRGAWSPVLCVKRQDFASKPCHLQACNKCHNPWREKHQHGKVLHF